MTHRIKPRDEEWKRILSWKKFVNLTTDFRLWFSNLVLIFAFAGTKDAELESPKTAKLILTTQK